MTALTSPTGAGYGQRLRTVVRERGPLCVGVDPHPQILRAWGLDADVAGLEHCARGVVDALAGTVAVFKPQSAFFEAYGSAGVAVLERVLADIRASGALSILDVKRGDIGSTMDAYAAAYLAEGSPLAADAVTLSPYLGFGSLRGAVDLAAQHGRGVYVLALTSNPEAAELQHAVTASGVSVARAILDAAAAVNAASLGDGPAGSPADGSGDAPALGHVGLVVGATIGRTDLDFTPLRGSILAPGLGAQGAGPADLLDVFGASLPLVLGSMSREVLSAGPDPDALRDAARRAAGEMEAAGLVR
jgi:orotidine-5'-phosphate decarboxylase